MTDRTERFLRQHITAISEVKPLTVMSIDDNSLGIAARTAFSAALRANDAYNDIRGLVKLEAGRVAHKALGQRYLDMILAQLYRPIRSSRLLLQLPHRLDQVFANTQVVA